MITLCFGFLFLFYLPSVPSVGPVAKLYLDVFLFQKHEGLHVQFFQPQLFPPQAQSDAQELGEIKNRQTETNPIFPFHFFLAEIQIKLTKGAIHHDRFRSQVLSHLQQVAGQFENDLLLGNREGAPATLRFEGPLHGLPAQGLHQPIQVRRVDGVIKGDDLLGPRG